MTDKPSTVFFIMVIAMLCAIAFLEGAVLYRLAGKGCEMDCVFTETAHIEGFNKVDAKTVITVQNPEGKK